MTYENIVCADSPICLCAHSAPAARAHPAHRRSDGLPDAMAGILTGQNWKSRVTFTTKLRFCTSGIPRLSVVRPSL